MDIKFIERVVKLVNDNEIDLIEYSQGEERLRIVRRHPPGKTVQAASIAGPAPIAAPLASLPEVPKAESKALKVSTGTEITSPMVGTFYRAPAPDAEPYLKVGDQIQVGQVLCIIEAMKLMNEIQSEYAGRVMDILVKNAQPVEFGQPLFLIERD